MKDEEQTKEELIPASFGAGQPNAGMKEHIVSPVMPTKDVQINALPKVLVVDDSPFVLNLLTDALTRNGYQVFSASDGKSALRLVVDELPDIVLLDIIMPVMDGHEVCRILKSEEKTRMIPVIFVSALDEDTDKIEGFKAGGADYITKPFQIPELLARIGVHLELQRLQMMLKTQNEEILQYTKKLEEFNVTLKVLLAKREEDIAELEENVLLNVRHLLMPHVEMLKNRSIDQDCRVILDIIELNLKNITSTFSHKLSSKYLGLTPTEIRIANLVKEGKQIKEVAEIMAVSHSAVELHRFNIRKKLGLKRKINLQSYLSSIS